MIQLRMVLGSLALVAMAACDAVKVPVVNPAGEGDPSGPTVSEPADEPAPAPGGQTDPAPTDSTGSTAPSTPNTSAPDQAGGTGTAPPPANAGTVAPPAPEPQVIPASIPSLGAINAARCGLPEGASPTPTVSVQAQALTGPQPESLLTVQAVGAVTVQSLTAFPGIVKMEPRRFEGNTIASGHCAATRIAERWFLTAAHCVDDEYDEIQFIAGTPNLRDLGSARMFKADAAICHSGYVGRETNFINDLALIRVSEDALTALTEVPIAEFGITDRPLGDYHYATADMAGWGMTGFNQPLSPLLLSAELNIVSASPSVIVISSREGAGPCIGDSGGPLYVTEADGQRTVVGVLSVVEQLSGQNLCEGDYRGRYTNITGYREWISDIMSQCAFQPDLCSVSASAPSANDLSAPVDPSEDAADPAP